MQRRREKERPVIVVHRRRRKRDLSRRPPWNGGPIPGCWEKARRKRFSLHRETRSRRTLLLLPPSVLRDFGSNVPYMQAVISVALWRSVDERTLSVVAL